MAIYRYPRLSEKARETYENNKRNRKLELKTNSSSKFEIYDTIKIYSPFPIDSIHKDMIHLSQRVDTTMKEMEFELHKKDSMGMQIFVIAKLLPEQAYQLKIDSAAFRDIYGACNDKVDAKLKVKSLDEYATVKVIMKHFDPRARIQLLSEKDEVLVEKAALEEGTLFDFLAPKTFYLRLYIDANEDKKWTTGDWLQGRQPEAVYYYPAKLKLRANWDFEETFDHLAVPQVKSKPQALLGGKKKKQTNNR
jgi:hypothetical protein